MGIKELEIQSHWNDAKKGLEYFTMSFRKDPAVVWENQELVMLHAELKSLIKEVESRFIKDKRLDKKYIDDLADFYREVDKCFEHRAPNDRWFRTLETYTTAILKTTKELIERKPPSEKELQLKSFGFPLEYINEHWPFMTKALIDNWDDTLKMKKDAGRYYHDMFKFAFEELKDFLHYEGGWEKITKIAPRIAMKAKKKAIHVYQWGLMTMKQSIIEVDNWKPIIDGLARIAVETDKQFQITLDDGLNVLKHDWLSKGATWEQIVDGLPKMINAAGEFHKCSLLINTGFRNLKPLVPDPVSWEQMVDACVKLMKEKDYVSEAILKYGFEHIKKDIGKFVEWEQAVDDLIMITKSNTDISTETTLFQGIQKLKSHIRQTMDWSGMIDILVTVGRRSETYEDAQAILKGLKYVVGRLPKDILTMDQSIDFALTLDSFEELDSSDRERVSSLFLMLVIYGEVPKVLRFFKETSKSTQKTEQLMYMLVGVDERLMPFLHYVIVHKPGVVFSLFSKILLAKRLDVKMKEELDVLLEMATPITLKEKDLAGLHKILRRFSELPLSAQQRYLKIIDNAFNVFQEVNIRFMDRLKASGFEDPGSLSFVDMAYIYFKYAYNPEVKMKKLVAALGKIQKNERKCLSLISEKANINDLNDNDRNLFRANLLRISEAFFEPAVSLLLEMSDEKVQKKIETIFGVKIHDFDRKMQDNSFQNALLMFSQLSEEKEDGSIEGVKALCFTLIKNYLEGNTYPQKNNLLNCYPWTDLKNQRWMAKVSSSWIDNFRQEYALAEEDVEMSNIGDRIEHHFEQSRDILEKLGKGLEKNDFKSLENIYQQLKKDLAKMAKEKLFDIQRHDLAKKEDLLSDLKTQVDALRQLTGQRRVEKDLTGMKFIITPEFDPLEILQMGNYVAGSCLATAGINYWSTVVNACEANKRVLWAKDMKGNIMARLLIAVDKSGKIVRFPVYYRKTEVNLDRFFDDYIIKLAKNCGLGFNGKPDKVEHLIANIWYYDEEVNIGEKEQRYARAS